jgi:16S rRNA (uracil1498-N3)-methyltransferase
MKETRFFFVPDAAHHEELPEEEAAHAVRVLRLQPGDEMMLVDGCGFFYRAEVTMAAARRCHYRILETLPQQRQWKGCLHLAVAPTKMMDRVEWLVEKATEIGFDRLSLLDCQFSERRVVKTDRLERIVISAMKQSRKAWKPVVGEMQSFKSFIASHTEGRRYIAHCYDEVPKVNLFDELRKSAVRDGEQGFEPSSADALGFDSSSADVLVMIGPEGDFSIDEVRMAVAAGFISVDLGKSRLRTETAALAAVMMMQLAVQ